MTRVQAIVGLGLAGLLVGCAVSETEPTGGGGQGAGGAGGAGGGGGATTSVATTSSSSSAGGAGGEGGGTTTTTATTTTGAGAVCGNGIIEPGETCEGSDFGGKECTDFGFSGGTLICNPYCNIVASQCTPVELCNDGADNDFDALPDCADPDCAAALACTDPCATAQLLALPGWGWGDILGEPDVLTSTCAPLGGREAVYQVTAITDGDLVISLWSDFDGAIAVRTDCNSAATEIACRNNRPAGQQEALTVPALTGQTFYVIVEANGPLNSSSFNVSIDQPLPEQFCDDGWDDDQDGYLDCDDPTSCQGLSSECVPGSAPYATPCFSNTECQATGGDPICLGWQQGFQNGYCSEFCSGPGDCGPNGACIDINISQNGVCFKTCATQADCPSGTACVDAGGGTLICDKPPEINCQDNQDNDSDGLIDCEDPTSCKGQSPSCASGPGAVGTPCQIHNQCAATDGDPICFDQFWWGQPGGYCSEFCDFTPGSCPSGSVCSNWFFLPSGNGTCLDTCVTQSDCRQGYLCTDIGVGQLVCVW